MHLKRTNIQNTDNGSYILLNTSKTGCQVRIPLPSYAIEIIEKYKRKSKSLVLPKLSKVKSNLASNNLWNLLDGLAITAIIRFKQGKAIELINAKGK